MIILEFVFAILDLKETFVKVILNMYIYVIIHDLIQRNCPYRPLQEGHLLESINLHSKIG